MAGAPARLESPLGEARSGDLTLARGLWLLILAQFLTSLPVTISSIFMPAIAADLDRGVALIGGLRSLSGVAALVCGILLAPLIDRAARAWTIAGSLLLLASASFLAARASLATMIIFYLLAGAAGALLQPALQSAAADGLDPSTGARAVAMLSATGALSAMLAAPLLAAPAAWWGWRGDFLAVTAVLVLLAVLAGAILGRQPPAGVVRAGYQTAFRLVAAAPGALPLLLGSTLRSTLWLTWVAFLPAFFAERFAASSTLVAVVWSLGGTAFFVVNLVVGRLIGAREVRGWRTPEYLLPVALLAIVALAPLSLLQPTLGPAMLATTLVAGVSGAALAANISLLVRRYTPLRGAVMGLNAAGLNLGLFSGSLLGGLAIDWAGFPGLALTLSLLGIVTLATTLWALRRVVATTL